MTCCVMNIKFTTSSPKNIRIVVPLEIDKPMLNMVKEAIRKPKV